MVSSCGLPKDNSIQQMERKRERVLVIKTERDLSLEIIGIKQA